MILTVTSCALRAFGPLAELLALGGFLITVARTPCHHGERRGAVSGYDPLRNLRAGCGLSESNKIIFCGGLWTNPPTQPRHFRGFLFSLVVKEKAQVTAEVTILVECSMALLSLARQDCLNLV